MTAILGSTPIHTVDMSPIELTTSVSGADNVRSERPLTSNP